MFKPRFITLTTIVFAAALSRLIPHPWNLTPVAAIALFGGAHFSKRSTAILVPLSGMLLSDLILGFHSTLPIVYLAFFITVLLGYSIRENKRPLSIAAAAVAGSFIFFGATNAGQWLLTNMYPKTGAGLAQCFIAAIPFFRNTLVGDLFFTGLLFGGFHVLEMGIPAIRLVPPLPHKTTV